MEVEADFELEKETKNTVRYQEEVADGKPPIVRTIYVQKWTLPKPYPKRIHIKITAE